LILYADLISGHVNSYGEFKITVGFAFYQGYFFIFYYNGSYRFAENFLPFGIIIILLNIFRICILILPIPYQPHDFVRVGEIGDNRACARLRQTAALPLVYAHFTHFIRCDGDGVAADIRD